MFVGHFGVAFGLKTAAPRTSLAWLVCGAILCDLLWIAFLELGLERARIALGATRFSPFQLGWLPWSHSLLLCTLWGLLLGGTYFVIARYKAGGIAIWAAVVSHWVLDAISHRSDMPFYPNSVSIGLSLYNSVTGTIITELAILGVGIWLYLRTTVARDRIGLYSFWLYVLILIYIFIGGHFAKPPASINQVVASIAIICLLAIVWAGWLDRHRALKQELSMTN